MYRLVSICVLCILFCLSNNEAARILVVIPTPAISHQLVFRPFTQELVRRGHKVTVITTDPVYPKGESPENLTEIDTHDVSYRERKKVVDSLDNGQISSVKKQIQDYCRSALKTFEEQTKLPEVQDIIKNKNDTFDLLIVEAWIRFALGFSHAIKVPVIAMSTCGAAYDNYDVMGAPTHPLLYPLAAITRLYNLSIWEKLTQYYTINSIMYDYWTDMEENENAVVKRIFGEDTPPLSELQNNVDMLFLNIHSIWEGNRPVPPGVIHIGGLQQKPKKELPQDLKKYLDSSVNGVIYISFGTNVETSALPADKIQAIIAALAQLPYDVLWKWNSDVLPGRTTNIRISKWFPQSDLLRHPKIKLFISHGGLLSIDEATTAGVPMIGIPMQVDQWYNMEKYVHHDLGVGLELAALDAEKLKSAIENVIRDKSYRENVERMRTIMYDQPLSSLERAVWWTEHALRHGGARHLRAPAANMPLADYYELPLALTVLSVIVAVIVLGIVTVTKLLKLVSSYVKRKVKRKSG